LNETLEHLSELRSSHFQAAPLFVKELLRLLSKTKLGLYIEIHDPSRLQMPL